MPGKADNLQLLTDKVTISTSTPVVRTGVYPHMLIAVTASGSQFVTRASRLPDQCVAPG